MHAIMSVDGCNISNLPFLTIPNHISCKTVQSNVQGGFFTLLTGSMALRFTVTGALLSATHIRIMLMTADNVWNEGVTIHRSQEV
jgi:hypothetical protein